MARPVKVRKGYGGDIQKLLVISEAVKMDSRIDMMEKQKILDNLNTAVTLLSKYLHGDALRNESGQDIVIT